MSHFAKLPPEQILKVLSCAQALNGAAHGARCGIIGKLESQLGWSNNKCWQAVKWGGYDPVRKKRSDSGHSKVDDQVIIVLAAMQKVARRANGKDTLKTPTAISIGSQSGLNLNGASASLINRRLKKMYLDQARNEKAKHHLDMQSAHPNHIHGVDPSLSLLYYTPRAGQRHLSDSEIYKNKPEWVEKIGKKKCWRYVLVDHYSASIYVKYYATAGENAEILWDFLLSAWRKKDTQLMHGLPKLMVWDKGSANKAKSVQNALKSLGVEAHAHKKGNPQAKGFVEVANNLVEREFESRLVFEPVDDVEALNAAAQLWCEAYNSNTLPNYNSELGRAKAARYDIWHRIKQEQLCYLPDVNICRFLFSSVKVLKKIQRNLTVRFNHPKAQEVLVYSVKDFNGIAIGQEVVITPLFYKDLAVLIEVDGYEGLITHEVYPEEFNDVGFNKNAVMFGQEFKQLPEDVIEKASKILNKVLYPDAKDDKERQKLLAKKAVPFNKKIDSLSHLRNIERPDYMTRQGTAISVPNPIKPPTRPDTLNQPQAHPNDPYRMNPVAALKYMLNHHEKRFNATIRLEIKAILQHEWETQDIHTRGITECEFNQRFVDQPFLMPKHQTLKEANE